VAFYSTGYDQAWSRYGPGRRIMATAIQGAIDEGATEFDFLRGHEEYKQAWGAEVRYDRRIHRPAGDKGRLLWGVRDVLAPFRRSGGRSRA
jgi:CelD/BcsL family acetyltransferase involved in cellulose biosynthesis